MITLLWAQSKNNAIGLNGQLPWDIKEEMQHFVNFTRNKTVLMGKNTWNSLKFKPLPNRKNIIITKKGLEFEHKDVIISSNLENILKDFQNNDEELIIIGGKQIFDCTLEFANKLVVSFIKKDYKGDVFAENIDLNKFKITQTQEFDEFDVITYERVY
ncbi:dihydrofolate reductase [Spiroplasma gladiatoris]|uniref:dihydrofolate reductase n=1 Tax=Spiroplasma gladiatoris TaxID=2143 RepID=A0A4P7AK35_9MOLU|nr:dihydrofolate reductase [Spiroplasma gladiatoris]QBQ07920.1 dihydrofolate reductase [Spiroplasma gladiatoris]